MPFQLEYETPNRVTETLIESRWRQAMVEEPAELTKSKTWTMVPFRSCGIQIGAQDQVQTIWLHNHNRTKLVAKGIHRIPGVDFSRTFSLVIKAANN